MRAWECQVRLDSEYCVKYREREFPMGEESGMDEAEQRKAERRKGERRVARPKIKATREDIMDAARNFQWERELPDWTTVVDGRELPARPLVLKAARVSDKNPTKTGEAAVILSDLGFEVRCKGVIVPRAELPV